MLDGPAGYTEGSSISGFWFEDPTSVECQRLSLSLCLSQRVDCQDMVSLGDMIQHNPQVKARTPVLCPVSSVGKRLDVCEVGLSHVGRAAHHFIESIWLGYEI